MTTRTLDLKELERKAYSSIFQDGLWDIYLGLVFMGFALGVLTRRLGIGEDASTVLHLAWLCVAMILLWAGKRYITVPRLGLMTPRPARQRRTRRVLLGAVVAGVILFLATAALGTDLSGSLLVTMLAVAILVGMGLLAYYLNFERLYGYAVLYALSLPVGLWLEDNAGLPEAPYVFFVTAGLSLIVGLVLLVRFLRAYPVHPEADSHARP